MKKIQIFGILLEMIAPKVSFGYEKKRSLSPDGLN